MDNKKDHKERIEYVIDMNTGEFVGKPVNISGVVIQAKFLEELKTKGKILCRSMLDFMTETINQEEPFELFEQKDIAVWLYGNSEARVRRDLARYQEKFGLLDGED